MSTWLLYRQQWKCKWIVFACNCSIARMLVCFPEQSSWCRNEQVCQGRKSVKHFERANRLDTALYINTHFYPLSSPAPGMFFMSSIIPLCGYWYRCTGPNSSGCNIVSYFCLNIYYYYESQNLYWSLNDTQLWRNIFSSNNNILWLVSIYMTCIKTL